MKKISLPLATSGWDEKEQSALQEVIKSGFFTMGDKVAQYEKDFAAFFKVPYAVMCSSGSTANLLMVAALFFRKVNPLKRGDEVIVPAVSWSTTYFPLSQYGLKLKFVDIDRDTLNYDLDQLEKAITAKTKLIMAVNLLGNPNDFARIQSLCHSRQIDLIEDNCESMGALFRGRSCGTFGLMGSFSSYFSHHISTIEGGVVVTSDPELYHILLCLRAHGWTRQLPQENLVTGVKSDDDFEECYKFVLPGYNVRPIEFEGALGIEQLKKLPQFLQGRRANAEIFKQHFGGHPHLMIQQETGESSWFGFSLVLRENAPWSRAQLAKMLKQMGVECRPIVAGNFAKNPCLKWIDHEIFGAMSNADWIDRQGLFIGNHPYPIGEQIRELRRALS